MVLITAKWDSKCAACGQPIHAGDEADWTRAAPKGQAMRHAACVRRDGAPPQNSNGSGGAEPSVPRGTNRRPGNCDLCGAYLLPGEGKLWKCDGDDGGCSNPRHFDDGGWHVECLPGTGCQTAIRSAMGPKPAAVPPPVLPPAASATAGSVTRALDIEERIAFLGLEKKRLAAELVLLDSELATLAAELASLRGRGQFVEGSK